MSMNEINKSTPGGRLKSYFNEWQTLTSDPYILNIVSGYNIEFDTVPFQSYQPRPYNLKEIEMQAIDKEILKLQEKGVIKKSKNEPGQYISSIFTRPKKDGGYRMILDLSKLNKNVVHKHFKMDTFTNALTLLSRGDYMASVDLKDAYYTVPISDRDTKFLKFVWRGQLYEFLVLPNGLSTGPRLFTKLLKPPLSTLRSNGHLVMGYIDDLFCVNSTKENVAYTVAQTCKVFQDLGFVVHPEKSQFEPRKVLTFLGFSINTINMTVSLPDSKKQDIIELCNKLLQAEKTSIRDVATLVGKMVAAFPAVEYARLHYRSLEIDKISALKRSKGHFDRPIQISKNSISDITWWISNIQNAYKCITRDNPGVCIESDASKEGWGATNGTTHKGGRWNKDEYSLAESNRINYLELLAAFFGLKSFCRKYSNIHVQLKIDNTTAIAYIQNMGGTKSLDCNELAKMLWQWCIQRNIWVTAAHIPGRLNIDADRESRKFQEETEWKLNHKQFQKITDCFGIPEIDIFASRLNTQLPRYVSWKPDPSSEAIDAFTLDWSENVFYAFPPFCLIGRCLQKIASDNAEGILVVPNWPSQYWYPKLKKMQIGKELLLYREEKLLTLPSTGRVHPLNNTLDLCVCRLSGKLSK